MPKYRGDEAIEELAGELMRHIDALTQRLLVPQQTAELSRSENAVLRQLADGPLTMSEISTGLGIAFSSATGVIDRLVERGLVERTRPQEDRRTVRVALTRRGHRMHDNILADRTEFGRQVLAPLDPRERETLLALFRKVTENDPPDR